VKQRDKSLLIETFIFDEGLEFFSNMRYWFIIRTRQSFDNDVIPRVFHELDEMIEDSLDAVRFHSVLIPRGNFLCTSFR